VARVRTLDAKGEAVTLGAPPKQFRPAPEKPAGLAWSKDGRWLALIHAHQDGKKYPVTLWEVDGKAPHTKSLLGHDDPVLAVAWSKDGKLIASGDEKGTVILWDAATGKELWRKKFTGRDETDGRINALAFSPVDDTLAAAVSMGSGKGPERIVVLAPESGKDVAHLMRPWHVPVASVAWGKNGKILVTGCGVTGGGIKQTEPVVGEVVVWER
jgi:WD40 repeat protein